MPDDNLDPEIRKQIFFFHRKGYTKGEIANRVGCTLECIGECLQYPDEEDYNKDEAEPVTPPKPQEVQRPEYEPIIIRPPIRDTSVEYDQLATLNEIKDAIKELGNIDSGRRLEETEIISFAYPVDGTTKTIPIGRTTIDFYNGVVYLADGTEELLYSSLAEHGRESMRSFYVEADQTCIVKLDGKFARTVKSNDYCMETWVRLKTLEIECTQPTKIFVYSCTNPEAALKRLKPTVYITNYNIGAVIDFGLATSGTSTTLVNSTKSYEPNSLTGAFIIISEGTGKDQQREIASNTATTITVNTPWTTIPDSTSEYRIVGNPQIVERLNDLKGALESVGTDQLRVTITNVADSEVNPARDETLGSVYDKLGSVNNVLDTIDSSVGIANDRLGTANQRLGTVNTNLSVIQSLLGSSNTYLNTIDDLQGALRTVGSDELRVRPYDTSGVAVNPTREETLGSVYDVLGTINYTLLGTIYNTLGTLHNTLGTIAYTDGIKKITDPLPAGDNNIGNVDIVTLPRTVPSRAKIDISSTGYNQIIAPTAGSHINLLKMLFVCNAAVDVILKSGSESLTGSMSISANGGIGVDTDFYPIHLGAGSSFNIFLGTAVQTSGFCLYTKE